jgi:hypothetical protein
MKKRLEKKMETRKRELIHRLLDLAMDINGLEPRDQSITGNLPTVFFDFSGHVGRIDVRIYQAGWTPGNYPDVEMLPSTNSLGELSYAVRRMEALKAETPGAATPRESK